MEGYGKRVLVADDEESVRRLVAEVLEQAGYIVHAAADGVEALGEMKKRRFDAVISDFHMPRLNGEQFLLLCRLMWPDIPVLLLSADLREVPLPLKQHGASMLLAKPFSSQSLLRALHESVSSPNTKYSAEHITSKAS